MSDDWRVEVDVHEHGGFQHLRDRARERAVASEARRRLGDAITVTMDDDRLYAYADSEAAAREAEQRLRELAADHSLEVTTRVARWHPEEQHWEPADADLPHTAAEHDAERRKLDREQVTEAAQHGYAEWEVRVELAAPEPAAALAERLASAGLAVVRRSEVVVVSVATDREARELAERLRAEVPEAVRVTAEGSAAAAMAAQNPLTVITRRWRST